MITVYVLNGKTKNKRYVGITNDLARRIKEHQSVKSTVQKILGDFQVLLTEEYSDYRSAREREKFLKSGKSRAWLDQQFGRDAP